MTSIAVLILAAGASTRMEGGPKQLLPWNGTTLLGHAMEQARQVSDYVMVVLGAHMGDISPTIPKNVEFVENPEWEKGMGSSIAVGVDHLLKTKTDLSGLLIMLADQPFLDAFYLKLVMAQYQSKALKIAATAYGKKVGVPAIFHPSLFSELSELHEDVGARHIIEKYKADTAILFPEGREIDIDTKKEYNQYFDFK